MEKCEKSQEITRDLNYVGGGFNVASTCFQEVCAIFYIFGK